MDSVKTFLRANAWIVVVVVLVALALYQFVDPAPPKELTIATGSEEGRYHEMALLLKRELRQQGVRLNIVTTGGSRENIEQLLDAESDVSIAFVQSGMEEIVETGEFELRSIGSLYYEPIWLFYRTGLNLTKLTDLRGRRLAIGEPGSGTQAIGAYLIAENGLMKGDDAIALVEQGGEDAVELLRSGKVDAAFFTISPQSDLIRELINIPGIDFMDIRRSAAYTALYPFLSQVTISEGLLDLEKNIPPSNRSTLASAATLVVNERFHPSLTPVLLESLAGRLKKGGILEAPNTFPSPENVGFELTKEAAHYFEYGPPFLMRYFPFWVASLVDRLVIFIIPLLVILIPLSKLAGPIYRWRIRSRIYRWYRDLLLLDRRIAENAISDPEKEREKLAKMADELAAIEVPLSYADELYHLKQHVEYASRRLS